tara:strand:+ start:354 stop:548 length:195 start_codon:yes stop_codon:yes gene_type:complete
MELQQQEPVVEAQELKAIQQEMVELVVEEMVVNIHLVLEPQTVLLILEVEPVVDILPEKMVVLV